MKDIEATDAPIVDDDDRDSIAFAIVREVGTSDRFIYGCRLLVTPFEVSQWRNAFLEVGCARPS